MQTDQIVAQLLEACTQFMHAKRLQALREVCAAAVAGSWLSLNRLACGMSRATTLRHRVKCVDRLLGNGYLWHERHAVYAALAQCWLRDLSPLLMVVDWSPLTADQQWHWLRASVVVEGRSVTLYEEVHPQKQLANHRVHRRFVERLAQLLPASAQAPIVLTDAGFRNTWFKLLAQRHWLWIGRIRNRDFVRPAEGDDWFPAKRLYAQAGTQARDLGAYASVRSNPIACRLVLIKKARKGRKHCYPSGKEQCNGTAKKLARRSREPWLLTCSPRLSHLSAAAIVNLYQQRMCIEQQFRDTKNPALGMGLSHSRTRSQARLQTLLLIAHIAQLAKRLIGEAAKARQLELQLMSTNRKQRAEISVMTLATRVIAHPQLLRSLAGGVRQHMARLRRQVTACYENALQAP